MQKDIDRIVDNVKVLNELCNNLQTLMNEAKTQSEEVINDVFYNTKPDDLIETMHLDEIQAITENLILRIKNLSFNIYFLLLFIIQFLGLIFCIFQSNYKKKSSN